MPVLSISRWFVLAGLVVAHAAAQAQPQPAAAHDALAVKASQQGSVRVIVGLAEDAQPEGRLSRLAATSQRASIRTAQDRAIGELLGDPRSRVHARFERVPHFAAEVDGAALARLRRSPLVRHLQEDVPVPPSLLQSTAQINAPTAWNTGRTGNGWAVAVLDTGVDKNHPFFGGRVIAEACYSSSTSQSLSLCPGGAAESTAAGSGLNCNTSISGCNHGTHVAGIVAGANAPDGGNGVAHGASIIAIQVFSHFPGQATVMSYTSDQIKALERVQALAATTPIAAVNMSLGGGQYSATCDASQPALKAAIDNLRSLGIATVIAAGNNGYRNAVSAPACISSAVSVGATCDAGPDASACATGSGGVASYSNLASFVSLLAPGSYIASSVPGSAYATLQGTSMAAPHVAGAWAVMKQSQPTIGVDDGLTLLRSHGVPTNDARSSGNVVGVPRIDLAMLAGAAHALAVGRAGSGQGTVISAPAGVACGSDCGQTFAEGTSVTLNAVATAGSAFAGWSGDCSGPSTTCTLTMTRAMNAVANFNALPYTLSVTRSGAAGSVSSSLPGIACGSACSSVFNGGTVVTLTATPATGTVFKSWSGACTGSTPTCSVSMTTARSVTATFAPQTLAVTVSKSGSGSGTVTSAPTGLSCGSTCTRSMAYGTSVTLTAKAAAGSVFSGWSGACSGSAATCTLSLTEARNVGAGFARVSWPLTVTRSGSGSVASAPAAIDCGSACSAYASAGSTVALTATPAANYYFAGWSGGCVGSAPTCNVGINAAVSVKATFKPITHILTVARYGLGSGSVVSSPTGISCGTTCAKAFNAGATVTLTARPASGSAFDRWSGACSGSAATCSLSITEAKGVAAYFRPL